MPELLLFAEQLRSFTSGLGTYARGLARGLAERGFGITIAVPEEQVLEGEPYRVVPLPFTRGNLSPRRLSRMNAAIRGCLAAEAAGHDLVHFLDARWATCLPADPIDRPVLGTVHDTYALDWREPGFPRRRYRDRFLRAAYYAFLRRIERRAYRRLTHVLTNSEHVRSALRSGYGIPGERMTVVRLGLPEEAPAPTVALAGEPSVLFVGGNYRRKGLGTLIAAVARVAESTPGIHLHVVGGDPRPDDYRDRATRLGIGDGVTFHGHTENDRVRGMMAGADLFAMPSFVEAFGLVYLEAMRAGTPVIATSRGGAAECFRDGEEIRLVPPDDVAALAAAIREVTGDASLSARLISGGQEAAKRVFFGQTLDETIAAYDRLSA